MSVPEDSVLASSMPAGGSAAFNGATSMGTTPGSRSLGAGLGKVAVGATSFTLGSVKEVRVRNLDVDRLPDVYCVLSVDVPSNEGTQTVRFTSPIIRKTLNPTWQLRLGSQPASVLDAKVVTVSVLQVPLVVRLAITENAMDR